MVRKKRGKKTVRKKAPLKNKISESSAYGVRAIDRKIKFILKNLIVFVLLTLLSYILYLLFDDGIYHTFFSFLYSILGVIAIALLLVLLILVFYNLLRKKR